MTSQLIAIAIFVAAFAIANLRGVHLGVVMFAAACGVGLFLADMSVEAVLEGFPIAIMVLLAGVTFFFAIAQANGTIDALIGKALGRVGDNAAILPFVLFALTAGISAMGSPLSSLMMAPIGMPIAKRYGIDPMLMALAIGSGLSAGAFAPTSLFGIVTRGVAQRAGVELDPLALFAVAVIANFVLFAIGFLMFGGPGLASRRDVLASPAVATASSRSAAPLPARFTTRQIVTLSSIVGLLVVVIGASLAGTTSDIGVLCFAFGAVLSLVDPPSAKIAVSKIDWSTVLLVGGIVTFVGVLQSMGAVDMVGQAATRLSVPILTALAICFIGALVSAFASTTGILAALVPLALPLVASGEVAGWALLSALAVCSSIVDVSPFSTSGATLIATAAEEDRPRLTSLLTRWGLAMIVIGPIVLVAVLVLPSAR
jgi:di/tricarboxylate transporter